MGIYTSDVKKTRSGKWGFVVFYNGLDVERQNGFESEDEAVEALTRLLAKYGQEYQAIPLKKGV